MIISFIEHVIAIADGIAARVETMIDKDFLDTLIFIICCVGIILFLGLSWR